jgi:hypothetical protein
MVGSYLIFTDSVEGRAKIILIVFVAVFGIMLFASLSIFKSYNELIDSPIPANVEKIVTASELGSVSAKYSISTWIYINDWNTNFGSVKNLISYSRGTPSESETNNTNFIIQLTGNTNDLEIKIPLYNSTDSSETYTYNTITVNNISIQKWVNIIVCVDSNNTDVYINGKLVSSTTYTTPAAQPTNQSTLYFAKGGQGFNGSISGSRYYNKFLTPQDCWTIYTDGFSNSLLGSFMNRYNASIVFYKDRQTINEINFM